MKIGTKSVLYGAHCFIIHPWFVALAWWKLYGFPWDRVYRKVSYRHKKRSMKVLRFFNDDGVAVPAEELEPLPINEFYKCPECKGVCKLSELQHEGDEEQGQSICPECGTVVSPETPTANPF